MSVFGVIMVRIFPHSDWIQTRITPNTNAFHAVVQPEVNLMYVLFLYGVVFCLYIDSKIILQEKLCENGKLQKLEPPKNGNSTLG